MKRCQVCGHLTEDWEIVGGVVRCWPCGKEERLRTTLREWVACANRMER
jgi:hypothetical protein